MNKHPNKYQARLKTIIEAFFKKQPKKGPLLKCKGGGYSKKEWLPTPMHRDEVIVEGETAIYLLWGNEMASWDGKVLCLNKHNIHHTQLTNSRLDKILNKLVSNKVGFEYYDDFLGYSQRARWSEIRKKLPYLSRKGFYYRWIVIHPFPLIIKASTLKAQFNKDIYIKKLLSARTKTPQYMDLIKQLNIPIPKKLKDKVAAKMFQCALDSYIAA